MELHEIMKHDSKFRYQLLGRMQSDCWYYLGYGGRKDSRLWALNLKLHLEYMQAIWDSFPPDGKPEWLTKEDMKELKDLMENPSYVSATCECSDEPVEMFIQFDGSDMFSHCPKCSRRFTITKNNI